MVQIVEEDIVKDRAQLSEDIQGPRLLLRASSYEGQGKEEMAAQVGIV